MNGYHGKILHVDLSNRSTRIEEPDELFYRLYVGGGLLGTFYLLKETQPGINPFSPDNLLIFSNSVIAGYPAAGLVRYVVTAKSPLTLGVGETRCEGSWAVSLKKRSSVLHPLSSASHTLAAVHSPNLFHPRKSVSHSFRFIYSR